MSESTKRQQTEFYVSRGEQQFGPWQVAELVERLGKAEVSVTDFVYDDVRADWIPLMECDAIRDHLKSAKPKAPPSRTSQQKEKRVAEEKTPAPSAGPTLVPKAAAPGDSTTAVEWYVQKGDDRYGPFSYLGILRALQEKTISDFDFVWKNGMDSWVRLAEHEGFTQEKIRELAGSADQNGVFTPRRHARVEFNSEVIVHDDRSVWLGRAFEAGSGGTGVVIENSTLNQGQVVRLHFAPCNGLPAFNAVGEIVGKRFSKEVRGKKSPVRYSVRFLKFDGLAEGDIRDYFAEQDRKAS